MQKANINGDVLRDELAFLLKQNLIEKIAYGKNKLQYEIKCKGATALQYYVQS
jgi:predicted transcriptional regulator